MTEKRFTINMEYECIDDAKKEIWIDFNDRIDFYELCEFLNKLNDENEQLKQRNNNQYNQLNQLWQLIEAKDWETLTAMNNQMKKDEERLQQEWKCYE